MNRYSLLLIFCVSINCQWKINGGTMEHANDAQLQSKSLTGLDLDQLLYVKENLDSEFFSAAFAHLIELADQALSNGPYSVMQKNQVPPSGDKHDYISLGPYWWPDPEIADGLPWIRRDGEVNPLTREGNTDYNTKRNMFNDVTTLGLAYFFSEDTKYAEKAVELIDVWFINPETKMNPNLNFAQGIPGRNTGRGIGIIEFAGITNIITTIEILELNNTLDSVSGETLRSWFAHYYDWLQTSENGVFEKNTKNNHATWYDVQVVSILLFLNRENEARQVLEEVKYSRIATQILPNGEQPHELKRTKSLSYSTMNLHGFTKLAYLGSTVGVDLWNYGTDQGAGIIKAFEFLKPYALGIKEWDHEQITSIENGIKSLKKLFVRAGSLFNNVEFCEIGLAMDIEYESLLYSCH